MPLVTAGLEDVRLLELSIAFVLEEVLEERGFDVVAIVGGGGGGEVHVADLAAFPARPTAVGPRTHDEDVVGDAGVGFGGLAEDVEGSGEVFGVEPSADGHDSGFDVLEVVADAAGAPEFVVGLVVHVDGPVRILVFEVEFVGVGEGTELEEELVGVGGAVVEGFAELGGRGGSAGARGEGAVEAEVGAEHEGSVMEGVVAHEVVADGGLGRGGLERGVGVDHAGGDVEAGVGDAPHADAPVVIGDVFDEPVDGVVGVSALVGVGVGLLDGLVGADFGPFAFRHVAAADILVDEDEAVLHEFVGGSDGGAIEVGAVGSHAVGGPVEKDGVGFGFVFWGVDGDEEADAVAHGDAEFMFGVVFADGVRGRGGGGGGWWLG